jgi:copper chaperone CopZ
LIAAIAWVEAAHRPRELVIPVSDMTCEGCEKNLHDKLVELDGVIEVAPSRNEKEVRVVVDGWSGPEQNAIEQTIRRAGYTVAE